VEAFSELATVVPVLAGLTTIWTGLEVLACIKLDPSNFAVSESVPSGSAAVVNDAVAVPPVPEVRETLPSRVAPL
jgi:hypothetical protein